MPAQDWPRFHTTASCRQHGSREHQEAHLEVLLTETSLGSTNARRGESLSASGAGARQTRDHLFQVCHEWKAQQKILWAEVLNETVGRKSRWKIRVLLADGRCSQAVLEFLSTTDVGRLVPVEEDSGSEVSEWERTEREE